MQTKTASPAMAKDVVEITAGSDEHHNRLRLEIPTKIKII